MTKVMYHIEQAKASLDYWYLWADKFLEQAQEWEKMWYCRERHTEAEFGRRQALKCKTLGLVFHDRYKLILENGGMLNENNS